MAFNENTRVKIPAILHMTRLGYEYVSLSAMPALGLDPETNILKEVLFKSIKAINPDKELDLDAIYADLKAKLDYDDLGKEFYKAITSTFGIRIIDFDNFDNNTFQVCTELTCKNGDDEFRPDITVFINGMPLAFIEVKKPNNLGGIVAESERMNRNRMPNKKFRRFLNATQLMVFSNNMEYSADGGIVPIQGAFYATPSKGTVVLNSLYEEDESVWSALKKLKPEVEAFVLKDTNNIQIKYLEEYPLNQNPLTPTNKLLSSLFSRSRLQMLLRFAIAFVKDKNGGFEKHIMRYPQFFATKAIEKFIDSGKKKGIVWHTQGSGKTALAYYSVPYLTRYFGAKNIVPKFYFVVDRLELLTQSQSEFEMRGLKVNIVNSREEFNAAIKSQSASTSGDGRLEIIVINIQKFSDDSRAITSNDYDLNIQRVYFLDEAHRSYNPSGSFLANLMASDRNGIFIGLTGTPLLKQTITDPTTGKAIKFDSKDVFGGYIHRYYYNRSIADGYTLKLIREGIETSYKSKLNAILEQLQIQRGSGDATKVYAHPSFVQPLTEYIIQDFKKSRMRLQDDTIGAMVVCHSSLQARAIFDEIAKTYPDIRAALILHDSDDKQALKEKRDEFKFGNTIDILIVYQMLLTGFDAPRLKKLYLNRGPKKHGLLQTLTRVNRPYSSKKPSGEIIVHRHGYVVDFADIRRAFDKTNQEYFRELQEEIDEEVQQYSSLFKSVEEIEAEIAEIKNNLFRYDTSNREKFSQQISQINDREEIIKIRRVLENAKILGNLIKLYGHDDLWSKIDFKTLNDLLIEANGRLAMINQGEALQNDDSTTNLLNIALEDVVFAFRKISEEEMQLGIVDRYKDQLRRTREAMQSNFDQQDPVFISLREELERLFAKRDLTEERTPAELENEIGILTSIYERITEQNRRDSLLRDKYGGDTKYARIHKRLIGPPPFRPDWSRREVAINTALIALKAQTDGKLELQRQLLKNEGFFRRGIERLVSTCFEDAKLRLDATAVEEISTIVAKEYLTEFERMAS